MKIGVPKELKNNESRVGLVPSGVMTLVNDGHEVFIQKDAGLKSGFTDQEYINAGGIILDSIEKIYDKAEFIVKVKEPQKEEYKLLKRDQLLFAFLHLAVEKELTEILLKNKVTSIACETIETKEGKLPVLIPMSEVAGRASVLIGSNLLQKHLGGEGILLTSVPGILPSKVSIIGAGTVGLNAAKMAIGIGADVTVLDKNVDKLRILDNIFGAKVKTAVSNRYNLEKIVPRSDLLISAVLNSGYKASIVVKKEIINKMKSGSVVMDISIDQGGSIETVDKVTTHDNPTYIHNGVIHYSVSNIPGAYPRTSTIALTNATIGYISCIASNGFSEAVKCMPELQSGVNTCYGRLTNGGVGEALEIESVELSSIIGF